jgi:ribonuclease P protein component
MDRGRVFRGKHFVLFCLHAGTPDPPRFGVFASRRLGGAVQRNRAKRRIREAYRRLKPGIQRAGVRIVFLARREAGTSPFAELMDEMQIFLIQADVLEDRTGGSPSSSPTLQGGGL